METQDTITQIAPPKLIKALTDGFNTVANHIGLILLPIILDLVIWFGPRIRLKTLVLAFFDQFNPILFAASPADTQETLEAGVKIWNLILDRFNLTSILSTFPIGLPSLMKGMRTNQSPVGNPLVVEMPSFVTSFLLFLGFAVIGIFLGGIYLNAISRYTSPEPVKFEFSKLSLQIANGFVLTAILILALLVALIPTFMIYTVFSLFSQALAQVFLITIMFAAMWILTPLIFSPHGIYAYQINAFRSILTSIRVVRAFLPGVGIFLLTAVILIQGLDVLWSAAPGNSWFTLIGITGHAFIYTGILSASFYYYRQGLAWIQNNINQYKKTITQ